MKSAVKTLILFSLLNAASARADIFMCKDASGHTLTSDRPIPECADRAMREYGKNGMVKRDIPAPPTAEQKREQLAQQEKKKAADILADEQKKADRALLARYQNEGDIERARLRDTASLAELIAQQQKALTAAEQEWNTLQAAAPAQKQAGGANAGKVGKAAQKALDARLTLKDTQAELGQVNAKYDQILKRYREISEVASSR
jgi:hypothetical protein